MKDGHLNKCSSCVVKDVAIWREKNPTARARESRRAVDKRGGMDREAWIKHKKENAIGRKVSALKYSHKRRLHKEHIKMTEFDEFVFEEAAALCALREKHTNIKWHVDHIVPLFHKDACGLHIAANLQVVPASWNFKKNNKNMNTYLTISGY
jgi:hypothetical protein